MRPKTHLLLALLVGACAGSSATLVAEPAPSPTPEAAPAPPTARGATHVQLSEAQVRTAPGDIGQIALLARGEAAFVGRLELEPLAEIPPHRDTTEEYIVVLEGGGTLLIDGRGMQIGPGSAVYMPAMAEVSYANGPGRLVAIQVFAGPEPAEKYDAWKPRSGSGD